MALQSLFSYASKENLDDLTKRWAIEEHVAQLLWGELNLQTLLDVIFKIAKYLMGTDARVITTSNFAKDSGYKKERSRVQYLIMIKVSEVLKRQTLFRLYLDITWEKISHTLQFFTRLRDSIEYKIEYDETMISIRLKVKQ
jgi:low temperature requirement protein LtrA